MNITYANPTLQRLRCQRRFHADLPLDVVAEYRVVIQYIEVAVDQGDLHIAWLGFRVLDDQGGVHAMRLTDTSRLICEVRRDAIVIYGIETWTQEVDA